MRNSLLASPLVIIGFLPFAAVTAYGSSVEVGFSRANTTALQVVQHAIMQAKSSIYVAAYQLTSPQVIKMLVDAKQRGVQVSVVLDKTQMHGPAQQAFVAANMSCRIDHTYRIMHHKFMVIDQKSVELGSFNYSVSADKNNAENALLFSDYPDLSEQYMQQWSKIFSEAEPCDGKASNS